MNAAAIHHARCVRMLDELRELLQRIEPAVASERPGNRIYAAFIGSVQGRVETFREHFQLLVQEQNRKAGRPLMCEPIRDANGNVTVIVCGGRQEQRRRPVATAAIALWRTIGMKLPSERSIPRHRLRGLVWPGVEEERRALLRSDFCWRCDKLLLASLADARAYLGALVKGKGFVPRGDDWTMRPYPCPRGQGWHIGHNFRALQLLKAARRKRAA